VINERLRDDYIEDCEKGIARWNRTIRENDIEFTLSLPHRAFQRAIGQYRETHFTPAGTPVSEAEWAAGKDQWLPSEAERAHVISLMQRVVEPGKFAGWIAPPRRGINGQPLDFDYVHLI
jgi:benzoyl-CoA 2,3-dioxygenase component B